MKEKILEILKDGECPSAKIASILNRGYYEVLKVLEELRIKNKIQKISLGRATFWKLKSEKDGD